MIFIVSVFADINWRPEKDEGFGKWRYRIRVEGTSINLCSDKKYRSCKHAYSLGIKVCERILRSTEGKVLKEVFTIERLKPLVEE